MRAVTLQDGGRYDALADRTLMLTQTPSCLPQRRDRDCGEEERKEDEEQELKS